MWARRREGWWPRAIGTVAQADRARLAILVADVDEGLVNSRRSDQVAHVPRHLLPVVWQNETTALLSVLFRALAR